MLIVKFTQEVGLGVWAKERGLRGARRCWATRKSVPVGVGVPGCFLVPGSAKKKARKTAVGVGLSGRGAPECLPP